MTTRTTSVTDTSPSADAAPGVQLVQPAVAQSTQPGLFDHLPDSAFTVHHRALVDARVGDRMLLCLALDVSPSAVKVATALAFHGWSSWPSRETLASLTNLHPNHVSRGAKELEDAGIISRRRRYHRGGTVGIQYTFGQTCLGSFRQPKHPRRFYWFSKSHTKVSSDSGPKLLQDQHPSLEVRRGRHQRVDLGAFQILRQGETFTPEGLLQR